MAVDEVIDVRYKSSNIGRYDAELVVGFTGGHDSKLRG